MTFEFIEYVRKPFKVEVLELTKDNIEAVNEEFKIGELTTEDGKVHIAIKRKNQNVFKVFPGFFVTKMGNTTRCFSRKIFFQQYGEMTPEWAEYFNQESA